MKNEKVLIVDDSKTNRASLKDLLIDDYLIIEAENGLDALEKMEEVEDIAAILLDLRMPVMDGYEFLKCVRANKVYDKVPVLVITAADGDAEVDALTEGANDFIIKPIIPEILKKRLENSIRLQRAIRDAERDKLTGLYNRGSFMEKVQALIEISGKDVKSAFYVADLDNFKKANDTHGHTFGDNILIEFSNSLLEMMAAEGNLIGGRIGGDEFALYLHNYKDKRDAVKIAEKCLESMDKMRIPKLQVTPTCSVGVAYFPDHGMEASQLYYKADQALYEAKGTGKHRYSFYGVSTIIETKTSQESYEWILDEMDAYVYICDAETHHVYYANAKAISLMEGSPKDEAHCFCYSLGLASKPYNFCRKLNMSNKNYSSIEESTCFDCKLFYKGQLIYWDGRLARLVIVSELK